MPRFYVEKDGEWNIFSTITDDFIFDEFVCLNALKARLLYERYKELTEDIDSLLTDRPRVNVMPYSEAIERICEDEPRTDEEYINNLPWTEAGNGEQTDCAWKLGRTENENHNSHSSDISGGPHVVRVHGIFRIR